MVGQDLAAALALALDLEPEQFLVMARPLHLPADK